jgi:hypothetical protein
MHGRIVLAASNLFASVFHSLVLDVSLIRSFSIRSDGNSFRLTWASGWGLERLMLSHRGEELCAGCLTSYEGNMVLMVC